MCQYSGVQALKKGFRFSERRSKNCAALLDAESHNKELIMSPMSPMSPMSIVTRFCREPLSV